VELCLAELTGGERVVEIGFGSGATFLNLNEFYGQICGLDLSAPAANVRDVFRSHGVETLLLNGDVLHMPYRDNSFDTVLAISIFEHLTPGEVSEALRDVRRVLKPGGQLVYGVPVRSRLMTCAFIVFYPRINEHHFSSQEDIRSAARGLLRQVRLVKMKGPMGLGTLYEVGHFVKP
jgi:ubiquinone/menaquinone biosynthesis C-methylase UbiE